MRKLHVKEPFTVIQERLLAKKKQHQPVTASHHNLTAWMRWYKPLQKR